MNKATATPVDQNAPVFMLQEDRNEYLRRKFVDAVRFTLANRSKESATAIRGKLLSLIGQWNPHVVCATDNLDSVVQEVVSKTTGFFEYVMHLKYVFFNSIATNSPLGDVKANTREIIDMLALSVSVDQGIDFDEFLTTEEERAAATASSLLPERLREDIPTASQVRAILAANPWLIIIMLVLAYIDLDHEVLK